MLTEPTTSHSIDEQPKLWALHIAGPDDVNAAPSEAEARAAADRFNAWFAQRRDPNPLDPQMHATAIEWPYSAEAHAAALPRWSYIVSRAPGVATCLNLSDCKEQQTCLTVGVCQRSKQPIRTLAQFLRPIGAEGRKL